MAYLIINGLSQPGGVVTAFVTTRLPLERQAGTRFVFASQRLRRRAYGHCNAPSREIADEPSFWGYGDAASRESAGGFAMDVPRPVATLGALGCRMIAADHQPRRGDRMRQQRPVAMKGAAAG